MDLYALPPEEFTAARDAAAKQARADGDRDTARALAALRRPSVSAHAVNRLVRTEPDLLAQLLDLGAALAQAQSGGQGDALRALGGTDEEIVELMSVVDFFNGSNAVASGLKVEYTPPVRAAADQK